MKKLFLFAACLFLFTGLMAQKTTARKAVTKPGVTGAPANQLTLDSANSVAAKAATKPGVRGAQSNQLTLDSAKSRVAAKTATKPGVRGEQGNKLMVDSVKGGGTQARTVSADKAEKAATDFIKQTQPVEAPPKKKPGTK